jgi:hypothetical protein
MSKAQVLFDKIQALPDPAQTAALRMIEQLSGGRGDKTNSSSPLARRFQELAAKWRRETEYFSFMQQRALHPAYQQIIGLGWPVVPQLLQELEKEPAHWFWALRAITGEQPAGSAETTAAAAEAWLRWGRERSLIANA